MTIFIRTFVYVYPKFKNFTNNFTKHIIPIGVHILSWKADIGLEISFVPLLNYMSFITLFPHLFTACPVRIKVKYICLYLAV